MAYILGFWFADGCIGKTKDKDYGYFFNIKQHKKDKYLLENVLSEMKSTYPLLKFKNTNCFSFTIRSKKIYNDIVRLGGKERKSLDCVFPKIPKKYSPDFIRGYFDGDGSIDFKANFTSGSLEFLEGLKLTLEKNIKNFSPSIKSSFYKKGMVMNRKTGIDYYKKDCIVYHLVMNRNDVRRLRNFMYRGKDWNQDKFKMIRKWEKFIDAGPISAICKDIQYLPFDKLKEKIQKEKLDGSKEYLKWIKSSECKIVAPSCPNAVYVGKWKGWKNFLGYENVKYHPNRDLTYKKLMKKAKEDKVETKMSYIDWTRRQREKGVNYPTSPERTFIEEWTNWREFLGTMNVK